jgi:hypothetical protein
VNAYTTAGWENFFVAEVGAAAALTGLIFVAVSINLSKVLQFPQLPRRAAESLVMLMTVLVVAGLGLVPGQPCARFGAEVFAVALVAWLVPIALQRRDARLPGLRRYWIVTRALTHQIAILPLLVGGASVWAGAGGGLYWLVPGTFLSLAAGLLNAWILLVEIQR